MMIHRKRPVSLNAKSLDYARRVLGLTADRVEQTIRIPIPGGKTFRRDLYGWMDVLGFDDHRVVGIQTCAAGTMRWHVKKFESGETAGHLRRWLMAHRRQAHMFSWARMGPRGKRKRWTVKIWNGLLVNGKVAWVLMSEAEHEPWREWNPQTTSYTVSLGSQNIPFRVNKGK